MLGISDKYPAGREKDKLRQKMCQKWQLWQKTVKKHL